MPATKVQFHDLRDRCVLVTGGGSGIGAALVEGFVRQGARVAFVDIDERAGADLCERLDDLTGYKPHFIPGDLRDIEAVRHTAEAAAESLGAIHVLVNNAARDDRQVLEAVTEESWDESQAVNLRHLFFMSQAVAPHMRQAGGGSIVNFSSIAFLLNMGEIPGYATAKAGIVGLTSFWVGQRRRQIGVRRALGATRGHILHYFQTENFLLATFGILIGMVLAYGINLFLMHRYELPRMPAIYFPVGAIALWLIGQLAVLGPALRAAAVPPVVATRSA